METPPQLQCPKHAEPLAPDSGARVDDARVLACSRGCRFPVVNQIPRFVSSDNYATGFGLQWNLFRKTQLDSYTGTTVSRERLVRCLGSSLDVLCGKSVLEVGCGSGRFTELMLGAGARVFACDLSTAVEANYENCHRWPNYFVCQGDACKLPVKPYSFDFVICLGVIQHTPSPEETIAALARYIKPGGTLVIDHYSHRYPRNPLQRSLRWLLIRLPARAAKPVALSLARLLLPLHRLTWKSGRGMRRLRFLLRLISPLIDYYDMYPQLGKKLLGEWAMLDTHDSLTDYYKHRRTAKEIEQDLLACGLVELVVCYGGNGVEGRAKMPSRQGEIGASA